MLQLQDNRWYSFYHEGRFKKNWEALGLNPVPLR
jgi:hypothetical protein